MPGGILMGASGAVYAQAGLQACAAPTCRIPVILPFKQFDADHQTLLAAFMLFDVACIVLGSRLGGALFGLSYGASLSKRWDPDGHERMANLRQQFLNKD